MRRRGPKDSRVSTPRTRSVDRSGARSVGLSKTLSRSSAFGRRTCLSELLKPACRWFDAGPGHHFQPHDPQRVLGVAGGPSAPIDGCPPGLSAREWFAPCRGRCRATLPMSLVLRASAYSRVVALRRNVGEQQGGACGERAACGEPATQLTLIACVQVEINYGAGAHR